VITRPADFRLDQAGVGGIRLTGRIVGNTEPIKKPALGKPKPF